MNTSKKIITLLVFGLLVLPAFSNAQQNGQGIHEPGTGLTDPELMETSQGTGQGMQVNTLDNETAGQSNQQRSKNFGTEALSRQSRVANTVQEMEKIATRNQGIGDQIRTIAQNQNRIQEEAEIALQTAQNRGGFSKFLIGPNYGQLKDVEERLENHNENLAELKELKDQIQDSGDVVLLDQQINTMEEIKTELEAAVSENQRGFSLFGWLNKLITR